jgi:hypothetical protein
MKAKFAMMALLGLLLTGAHAEATVILLHSPSIDFKADVDKKLVEAVHAVVQDKRYDFLGGGQHVGWGPEHDYTNLSYRGDTTALDSFLTRLSRIPGLQVKVRLDSDLRLTFWKDEAQSKALAVFGANVTRPVPGWEVIQSKQSPDRLEVWINLAAKGISLERLLEKWLADRARDRK